MLLLIGSYFFYGWWDWRFLPFMIGFSLLNYWLGYYIHKTDNLKTRKYLSFVATFAGIGLLVYFKYANFFLESFAAAFAKLNIHLNIHALNLILPLGISFYTFRTLSYIYDIKNRKLEPTGDWVAFFSFVAFFPSLLSGPIDKAKSLLPQLEKQREFNYATAADASRQILWGFFKKVVIADNLINVTGYIFDNYYRFPGNTLLLGTFYYAIQLYTDFSAYSDMAIGFAKLLGFEVTQNFNFPFFSQNIAEYWRKWHISLTAWLTDYVFAPLAITFRDFGKTGLAVAIIINFVLIGMWHGANWTFALFGLLHGCYFIPLIIAGKLNKKKSIAANKLLPTLTELKNMVLTFIQVCLALVIFRAANLSEAFITFQHIFSKTLIAEPIGAQLHCIPFLVLFLIVEWLQRAKQFTLQIDFINNVLIRTGIYFALLLTIFFFSTAHITQFIYMKF